MITYCIVNRIGRAVDYGIGTYSRHLLSFLQSAKSKITPVLLNIYRNLDKPSQEFVDGVLSINIPDITDYFDLATESLLGELFNGQDVVFHFNHLIVDQWAPILKIKFPSAIIVCTVHYLSWYYSLLGNKDLFYKIIRSKGLASIHPKSQYTYTYYKKNTVVFQYCDYVVALCQETLEMLINSYNVHPDKLFLIPNGIPPLQYSVIRNVDKPVINIIYVGRIDPIKGVYYLAQAFNLVKVSHSNVCLHLVGDTNDAEYLQRCINVCPDIIYHGKIPHHELDSLYQQADIGVLPSFHEQCSYSLIEMMSHGLPIIGTTATGNNDMLEPMPFSRIPIELAFVNESAMVNELASAILRFVDSPKLRKESSDIAYSLFCQRYTRDIFFGNMKNFLYAILS